MSVQKKIAQGRVRRVERVRKKLRNTGRPRISIFKSAQHIYAQLIDDAHHKTLASCSTIELKDAKGAKKEVAHAVGKEFAQRALKAGVQEALFDRGAFLFHGRVAALAQGMRDGGLRI